MSKSEFLISLQDALSALPKDAINEHIGFYSEIIDDYIEDGLQEEDAVKAVGSVQKIAESIIADTPLSKLVKEKIKLKKKPNALTVTLIAVGSPIWLSLLIALFAVVLAVYVSLWAVVIALWASFVAVLASGFGGIAAGGYLIYTNNGLEGLFLIGASIVCIGLSILLFFLCKLATKGVVLLLKWIVLSIKGKIAKRGERRD